MTTKAQIAVSSEQPVRFDNSPSTKIGRLVHATRSAKARLLGVRPRLGALAPHFWFEVSGRRFVYAYIRKNACSSFKAFITETSVFNQGALPEPPSYSFLSRYHQIRDLDAVREEDIFLFVWRDPVVRSISLYKNKFIVRSGNQDIWASVRRLTGRDPENLSFDDFVKYYVVPSMKNFQWGVSDPHLYPQVLHLAPRVYHAAIELDALAKTMYSLIPDDKARLYFGTRANASLNSVDEGQGTGSLARVPSSELHAKYRQMGTLPANSALRADELGQLLTIAYRMDYEMIAEIRRFRCEASIA